MYLVIGMDMVPSIIDVWGYDRKFCSFSSSSSSSSSTPITQKQIKIHIGYTASP